MAEEAVLLQSDEQLEPTLDTSQTKSLEPQPAIYQISCMVILLGDGLDTLDKAMLEYLQDANPGKDYETLKQGMEQSRGTIHTYHPEMLLNRQRVVVLDSPIDAKSKEEVRDWLKWLALTLEHWGNRRITTLVSPSEKCDLIVKITARLTNMQSILVNTEAKAAPPVRQPSRGAGAGESPTREPWCFARGAQGKQQHCWNTSRDIGL